jgi:osmotically-inducible protein OsmY
MSHLESNIPSAQGYTTSPDRRVGHLAECRLRDTTYPALKRISCEFHNGVAVLRGSVPTFYLKQVAQSVVRKLDEVKQIDNRIDVAGASACVEGERWA